MLLEQFKNQMLFGKMDNLLNILVMKGDNFNYFFHLYLLSIYYIQAHSKPQGANGSPALSN